MGRNGNGNDTHYAAVNRSDVPQGRKGKHRKAVADILADLSKLKRPASGQDSAEQSERREDAESSLCFEPRNAREEHPRGNVERREIPVRLARRPAQECGSHRIAGPARKSGKPKVRGEPARHYGSQSQETRRHRKRPGRQREDTSSGERQTPQVILISSQ